MVALDTGLQAHPEGAGTLALLSTSPPETIHLPPPRRVGQTYSLHEVWVQVSLLSTICGACGGRVQCSSSCCRACGPWFTTSICMVNVVCAETTATRAGGPLPQAPAPRMHHPSRVATRLTPPQLATSRPRPPRIHTDPLHPKHAATNARASLHPTTTDQVRCPWRHSR